MDKDHKDFNRRFKKTLTRHRLISRVMIFAEDMWSILLFPLCILGLFVAASWFGLFRTFPFWVNIVLAALFAGAFFYSLLPIAKLQIASKNDADKRLEEDNHIPHQALAIHDQDISQNDPAAAALWKEHQRRMLEKLGKIQFGNFRSETDGRDPYGLRALVLLLLVTGFSYSFSGQSGTILDAFSRPVTLTNQADLVRIDAWVKPPSYVNQAPIFLKNLPMDKPLPIPERSQIVVQIAGEIENATPPEFILSGGSALAFTENAASLNKNATSFTLTPVNDGVLNVSDTQSWQLTLVRDEAPNIEFTTFPERALNGALELEYSATDDHGVASARAVIVPLYPSDDHALPLYELPEFELQLPRRGGQDSIARTTYDLTEHPLAGEHATITLIATDHAGQETHSEALDVVLPERQFISPLAKSMLEQRKILAFDAYDLPRAIELNDALTVLPEETIPNMRDFLLIKTAREGMNLAYSDEDLLRWVDDLWTIALLLEDGDLSLAEQRLKNAQKALQDALENDASEEEIAELMEELREAMEDYLQQLAQNNANQQPQNQQQNAQELEAQDLTDMLDQIEEMARSGNKEQAQRMLNELQNMMSNLQANRQPQQQSGEQGQMEQQLNELGEILREQQRLLDETFQQQQEMENSQRQKNRQGQQNSSPTWERNNPQSGSRQQEGKERQPMTEEELAEALEQLQQQQQALQEQLQELLDRMEKEGLEPTEGLGEAEDAMGDAAGELEQGQTGPAGEEQGRAIQALREGAQQMLDQLQQQMQAQQQGPGQGQGQGQQQGQNGQGQGRDPLGRRSGGERESVYGQNPNGNFDDATNVQRAREILEIIRKRLGENFRLEFEKNYLERLLKTPQ